MMQGRISVVMVTLFGVVMFIAAAEAKEIRYDTTQCYVGTLTMVSESEELKVQGWELRGIARSNLEDKTFDGSTLHCLGTTQVMAGKRTTKGYCKYMEPSGDFMVGEVSEGGEDSAGIRRTWKVLQGTGKWQGITGGGKYQRLVTGKPITKGTFQHCSRWTGTYTLPD